MYEFLLDRTFQVYVIIPYNAYFCSFHSCFGLVWFRMEATQSAGETFIECVYTPHRSRHLILIHLIAAIHLPATGRAQKVHHLLVTLGTG